MRKANNNKSSKEKSLDRKVKKVSAFVNKASTVYTVLHVFKENISIRELIQEKIEDSISLKPKSQLRESINNTCKYEIDKAVNKVVYELQKEMNEQITLEMAKKIKEKLLS